MGIMKSSLAASLLLSGMYAGLVAGIATQAHAESDPFAQDTWAATDANRGFGVEVVTYEELMAMNADDRRVYLMGLRNLIENATTAQDLYSNTFPAVGSATSPFGSALALISTFLPQASADDAAPSIEERRIQAAIDDLTKRTNSEQPGNPCNPSVAKNKGAAARCKDLRGQLASAQAELTSVRKPPTTNSQASTRVQTAQKNLETERGAATQRCIEDAAAAPEAQAMCGITSRWDARVKQAQTDLDTAKLAQGRVAQATDPNAPKTEAQARQQADAAKKAYDASYDSAVKLCQTAAGPDGGAACANVGTMNAETAALKKKSDDAAAALKGFADKKNGDLALSIHQALGGGCLAKEKPLACPSKGVISAKDSDYDKARKVYQSKLSQTTQCMTGFLPSSSYGACLNVHSIKVGGLDLKCAKASTTLCNPWVYGANKTDKGYEPLCTEVSSKGTPKKRGIATIRACDELSNDKAREFVSQPIPGMKEGWENNVRNPISHLCGGPLRAKANCEVCNQMAKDAQVAISASGHIRKCTADAGEAAGAEKKSGTAQ